MREQHYWVLDGKTPVPARDMEAWGAMFEDLEARKVDHTEIGEVTVSTVFLGLNHRFSGNGPPILFETMIHGISMDDGWDHQTRYCTWDEAQAGHDLAVEWVRSVLMLADDKARAALDTKG